MNRRPTKPFSHWRDQLFQFLQGRVNVARARDGGGDVGGYVYHYANAEDFTLRNGTFYKPQRDHRPYRDRELGRCFINALTLAEENPKDLKYCEGFALAGYIPTEHAFNVDRAGRVVDVTWQFGDPAEPDNPKVYCGVVYPTDVVRRIYDARDYNDLICSDWVRGWPLLQRPFTPRRLREVVQELYAEG